VKRTELLAVGIGVLASGGLFAMERAYAGEDDPPGAPWPRSTASICPAGQRRCSRRRLGYEAVNRHERWLSQLQLRRHGYRFRNIRYQRHEPKRAVASRDNLYAQTRLYRDLLGPQRAKLWHIRSGRRVRAVPHRDRSGRREWGSCTSKREARENRTVAPAFAPTLTSLREGRRVTVSGVRSQR
jgi:hypothetical protein